ncbi:MAG: HAD family hydrolase [Candidatus Woesearchaeota archaeon]
MTQPVHVIFDWDGTLQDNLEQVVHAIQQVIPNTHVTPQKINAVGLLPALLLEHGTSPRHVYKLIRNTPKIRKTLITTSLYKGVCQTLDDLANENYILSVVSRNDRRIIEETLRHHKIRDYFTHIEGVRHKTPVLKKFAKESACVYVGDEISDAIAARNADVRFVAATYGHTCPHTLYAWEHHYAIDTINDLPHVLKKMYPPQNH